MNLAILLSALAIAAEPSQAPRIPAAQVIEVSRTFNEAPFRYRAELRAVRPGYRVFRLTYPSPVISEHEPNNTVPADYYLPDGAGQDGLRRPAVIVTHILDGNFVLAEMICSLLATRGIPAMMIKLPYYGERALPGGPEAIAANPQRFAGAMHQAIQDMQRTVDVLASRPEIDPRYIGITGISLGGIVSATAAGAEPRLSRAALMMAGGDLLEIIHHARETAPLSKLIKDLPPEQRAELEDKIRSVDPLRFSPRLRDLARQGNVLMINAGSDEVVPRACTEKLAAAMEISDKVVWLRGLGHYSALAELPRSLEATADFFARDLPEGIPRQPRRRADAAFETVLSLIGQLGAMLGDDPPPGRCRVADLDAWSIPKDGKMIQVRLRLIRGCSRRFRLDADLPATGSISLGQGRYPWLASGEATVIAGTKNPADTPRDPRTLAGAENFINLRMATGAIGALEISPDVMRRWINVEEGPQDAGERTIRLVLVGQQTGSARITFEEDGRTPRLAEFEIEGTRGSVRFRAWQTNAVADDSMFEPPQSASRQEMDQATVYGLMATLLKLAG